MKNFLTGFPALLWFWVCAAPALAQSELKSRTTYSAAYGKTRHSVEVDPNRDLPRYPAVEAAEALQTWKLKPGFRIELAAHEPQVCDPIAVCFDERGRMFVCEMIDYSEMRDAKPHLGRVRMLEDLDGDGKYESATVFADDLPWPTGLIWANGGLFVAATPDIWRFVDGNGDGKAEQREKVFTGFGTGLKLLNVQGLLNSFQWGQDNRVHVLAGGGNRGMVRCEKRPDLPGIELAGRDFWFDPRTLDFGVESGGAQYGMSFDDYGRKYGCSNSDHLQHWVYDAEGVGKAALSVLPAARQSIAADGGAAEVFRISPDEPWRIVRTRLRVTGAVGGSVEGGGRVSGYFTGATGTTIYRGDALGPDFVGNSFSGDAGGQLVHRKLLRASADGVNRVGERPADERDREFAASTDTWVRVVNFANAPDGCLYVVDMYREIIEHPWSIPDEIKRHLDLNQGNDRGRIYRILPEKGAARVGARVALDREDTAGLVATLSHPNGWHRDTAHRLLFERRDPAAVPLLVERLGSGQGVEKLHALGILEGLGAFTPQLIVRALEDPDTEVRRVAVRAARRLGATGSLPVSVEEAVARRATDTDPAVRFECALATAALLEKRPGSIPLLRALGEGARRDGAHGWIGPAILSAPAEVLRSTILPLSLGSVADEGIDAGFGARILELCVASAPQAERESMLAQVVKRGPRSESVRALGVGLQKIGLRLEQVDTAGLLLPWARDTAAVAVDPACKAAERVDAIRVLAFAARSVAEPAFEACLSADHPPQIQSAAIDALLQSGGSGAEDRVLARWTKIAPAARRSFTRAVLTKAAGAQRLLSAVESGRVDAADLDTGDVQSLLKHRDAPVAALARKVLSKVIPPSREETITRYTDAVDVAGDGEKGRVVFSQRCAICHVAEGQGASVGPDMVTVKTRGREGLLRAIVHPNQEVAAQYIQYAVQTRDDETLVGVVFNDSTAGMTLRMPGGGSRFIDRARIKSTSSSGQSLMPEGLEAGLSVKDMADLLTFIETLK